MGKNYLCGWKLVKHKWNIMPHLGFCFNDPASLTEKLDVLNLYRQGTDENIIFTSNLVFYQQVRTMD